MTISIVWLPSGGIYLEKSAAPQVRPHRPWSQGDIFVNVPIYIADGKLGKPREKLHQGPAMLLGHPCSLRGGTTLAVIQNVCRVREAKDKEAERLAESEASYRQLFPLPDFLDGALWVADFNHLASVKFTHLNGQRIACLNHEGWAALQLRYSFHSTRIDQPLEQRVADIRATWAELELWEEWCARGHAEADFQRWLSEPLAASDTETTRRAALELFPDLVRAEVPE